MFGFGSTNIIILICCYLIEVASSFASIGSTTTSAATLPSSSASLIRGGGRQQRVSHQSERYATRKRTSSSVAVDVDDDGSKIRHNASSSSAQKKKKKKNTIAQKKSHDRTIDRRKSPALWRYDLEYSIATKVDDGEAKHEEEPNDNNKVILKPPELMSPAGGYTQLKAAVANGADAIYVGMTSYSARARAENFNPDPTLLLQTTDGGVETGEEEYEPVEGQPASLAYAAQYCHKHHVRLYVAFNTLVFDNELHEVQHLIEQIWDCGVDAVIVQDVGVAKIVTEVVNRLLLSNNNNNKGKGLYGAPLEIHASTQQSVTCADGVSFAAERTNATRVVLGRELSLDEITDVSKNTDTEIEAFVHGALCVSYSGQCFSSEAWGGRSANRGQCAQACRLPYGLIANGELKHLSFDGIEGIMGGGRKGSGSTDSDHEEIQYLLSPQDLCGLEQVEGLVKAGVSCLKIEGRLKDATYVAATTRAYRQAIDAAWKKVLEEQSDISSIPQRILSSPDESVSRLDLTQVFARGQDEVHDGLTPGFFEGPQHQRLVRGRSPRHRGRHVGRVVSSNRGTIVIQLDEHFIDEGSHLKRGDGLVVDRGMPQEKELGGPIYDVRLFEDDTAAIRFGRDVERQWMENDNRRTSQQLMAPAGAHVWLTSDADIRKRMNRLAELSPPKSSATVTVEGCVGEPLSIRIYDERSGKIGVADSSEMGTLELATGSPINKKSISKAIGTLGNSQWSLSKLDLSQLEDGLWCPMSYIKDTRRRAIEDLERSVSDASTDTAKTTPPILDKDDPIVDHLIQQMFSDVTEDFPTTTHTKVSVLARSEDQVNAICELIDSMDGNDISEIIVDFLEIDGIRNAVSRIREVKTDLRVVVASPRIIKPGEEGIWRTLLKTQPDALLIRSTGLLHRLTQLGGAGQQFTIKESGEAVEVRIPELIGDFSLNAANAISAYELLQSGLSRITAAYDLSANAITELASLLGKNMASKLDVVVHQHMPIFHTEHCVFARFLSKGNSYQDCGHVCTRNNVHLRDQNGQDNLVLADMGCRNTVFMSEAQSGVGSIKDWMNVGIGCLRIELVDESGEDSVKIISSYLQFLNGESHEDDVWNVLKMIPDSNGRLMGVGVGSLRNSAERRSGALSGSSRVH